MQPVGSKQRPSQCCCCSSPRDADEASIASLLLLDSDDDNSSGSSVGMPALEDQEVATPLLAEEAAAGG